MTHPIKCLLWTEGVPGFETCKKEKDNFLCTRKNGHPNKHHAHTHEGCVLVWK